MAPIGKFTNELVKVLKEVLTGDARELLTYNHVVFVFYSDHYHGIVGLSAGSRVCY